MELIDTPANPCPPGAQIVGLRTSDGLNLRAAYWRPEGIPRGTVAVIQGRAEFIEKYFEVIGELLSRGFVVASFRLARARACRIACCAIAPAAMSAAAPITGSISRLSCASCLRPTVQNRGSPSPIPWGRRRPSIMSAAVDAPFARIVGVAPMLGINGFGGSATARHIAGTLHGLGMGRAFIPGGGPRTLVEKPFEDNVLTSDRRRFERSAQLIALAPALGIGDPTIGWLNAA